MGNKARFLHFPGTLPASSPPGGDIPGLRRALGPPVVRSPRRAEGALEVDYSAGQRKPLGPLLPIRSTLRVAAAGAVSAAATMVGIDP